jgi:chromosome segregation ATPase
MNSRELYQQKKEAQLNEWKADIDKLKAKTAMASANAQIEMNKEIDLLEKKIDEGKIKLSDLIKSADDIYESLVEGVESAWDSLKITFNDVASKFKH